MLDGGSSVVPITMASNVITCDSCDGPQCNNRPTSLSDCCA